MLIVAMAKNGEDSKEVHCLGNGFFPKNAYITNFLYWYKHAMWNYNTSWSNLSRKDQEKRTINWSLPILGWKSYKVELIELGCFTHFYRFIQEYFFP